MFSLQEEIKRVQELIEEDLNDGGGPEESTAMAFFSMPGDKIGCHSIDLGGLGDMDAQIEVVRQRLDVIRRAASDLVPEGLLHLMPGYCCAVRPGEPEGDGYALRAQAPGSDPQSYFGVRSRVDGKFVVTWTSIVDDHPRADYFGDAPIPQKTQYPA